MKTNTTAFSARIKPHKLLRTIYRKIGAKPHILFILIGIFASAFSAHATTYTWVGTGKTAWSTPGNWSPLGPPAANSDVIFNNVGIDSIINIPNNTLKSFTVTGASNVTLEPPGGGTRTITLSSPGTALNVGAGAVLTISGYSANNLKIVFSGIGNTATIAGTLNLAIGISTGGGIYNATNSSTTVSGVLTQITTTAFTSTASNLVFSPTGKFQLLGTSLTVPAATWQAGSTCEIAITGKKFLSGLGQAFSNFTVNCPATSAFIQCDGALTTINGNLTIINTNSSSGKNFRLTDSTNFILTVKGNLDIQNNSTLNLTSGTGSAVINLEGNLTTAGTGQIDQSGSGSVRLNFYRASGIQNVTLGNNNSFSPSNFSATINVGTGTSTNTVRLNSNMKLGNFMSDFTVNAAGTFDMQNFVLSGPTSTFDANAGSTLIIGHASGIDGTGATGNVQVGLTKTYSPAANYIYNGLVSQVTGTALVTANNLTISNSNGVSQTNGTVTVNGTLTFVASIYAATGSKVIVANNVVRSTGHVNGNLQKSFSPGINVTRTFEIGDAVNYTPAVIIFTSVSTGGSLKASTTKNDHPNIASSLFIPSKTINRFWTFTNSGIGFTNYSASFNYVVADIDPGVNTAKVDIGRYGSGNWTYPAMGIRSGTSAQAIGLTGFNNFQIGTLNNPLPVELLSFKALVNENDGDISWATTKEVSADYYSLERSPDGINFMEICRKPMQIGSETYKYYTHTDRNLDYLKVGTVYYRLNEVDLNGEKHYSNVISLKLNSNPVKAEVLRVYPNPCNGEFKMKVNSEDETNCSVQIMDRSSRIIFEENMQLQIGINEQALNLHSFSPGIYFLKINFSQSIEIMKIVIQ